MAHMSIHQSQAASAIVVLSSPPQQIKVRHLLHEIISPTEQTCFPS